MKYLKTYKIFESTNDIVETLKDIFAELKDSGFLAGPGSYSSGIGGRSVSIRVRKKDDSEFSWDEVKEEFLRSMEYLRGEGMEVELIQVKWDEYELGIIRDRRIKIYKVSSGYSQSSGKFSKDRSNIDEFLSLDKDNIRYTDIMFDFSDF